jgi:hypothetical protein
MLRNLNIAFGEAVLFKSIFYGIVVVIAKMLLTEAIATKITKALRS